ncbi:hypothetical protein BC830DRAFT_265346 [Chytriomyces sp. MP71]|nr:hypothetical protein BC830DRAFT_265346 [Chytriomyces sp. MP71]
MDAMIDLYNNCQDPAAFPFGFTDLVPTILGSRKYYDPFLMQNVCQGLGIPLSTARINVTLSSAGASTSTQLWAASSPGQPQTTTKVAVFQTSEGTLFSVSTATNNSFGSTPDGSGGFQKVSMAVIIGASVGGFSLLVCVATFVYRACFRKPQSAPVNIIINEVSSLPPENKDVDVYYHNAPSSISTSRVPYASPRLTASTRITDQHDPPSLKAAGSSSNSSDDIKINPSTYQLTASPVKANTFEETINTLYSVPPGQSSASLNKALSKSLPANAPGTWTVEQASVWARGRPRLGAKFADAILYHRVEGAVLLGMTTDDIKREFGLVYGEAIVLSNAINELREEHNLQEAPPAYEVGMTPASFNRDV